MAASAFPPLPAVPACLWGEFARDGSSIIGGGVNLARERNDQARAPLTAGGAGGHEIDVP
jgi:hypothetical protein